GARATDLLARTEHDGEQDPDLPYLSTASWRRHVRDLAARARTNQISATQLREAAESSWLEYRDSAELPEPGDDRRAAWLSGLGSVIAGLQADVDASSDPAPSAGKPPLTPSAARTVAKRLVTLEQLHRNLARHQRSPWSLWAKLAGVASGKAADGGSGGDGVRKDLDQDRTSTRLNTSHVATPYAARRALRPFPTRRSADLGKPPLTPSAARTVAKRLVTLEQLHRNLARHQRSPWSLWAKLAGVASGKAADGGSGGYVFSKDVDQALLGLATEIETGLLANPVLQ